MGEVTTLEWMRQALAQAEQAARSGEVPVGAIVVYQTEKIGGSGNQRESRQDPIAHAEILALQQAAVRLNTWRLTGATMYVTQEPCLMCAGAILNARISRLVYGCKNPKAGSVRTLYQVLEDPRLNHRVEVIEGVLAEECGSMLSRFFEHLRGLGKK